MQIEIDPSINGLYREEYLRFEADCVKKDEIFRRMYPQLNIPETVHHLQHCGDHLLVNHKFKIVFRVKDNITYFENEMEVACDTLGNSSKDNQ